MAKVDLTIGESKTKVDLTLEDKADSLTWDDADWTWDSDDSSWANPKLTGSMETKTKDDLTLGETK